MNVYATYVVYKVGMYSIILLYLALVRIVMPSLKFIIGLACATSELLSLRISRKVSLKINLDRFICLLVFVN